MFSYIYNSPYQQQYFFGASARSSNLSYFVPWTKPPGIKMVSMLLVGGGGAGGAGGTGNVTNTNRSGGSGGGSGGITQATFPAAFLPDVLYIYIGRGGIDTAAANTGENAYVSIQPSTNTALLLATAKGGSGGTNGAVGTTTTAVSAAGAAGTIATVSDCPLITGAVTYEFLAGAPGVTGGGSTTATGTSIVPFSTASNFFITGGAGGGGAVTGSPKPGGSITSSNIINRGYFNTISGGQTDGANAAYGQFIQKPLLILGGAGGAGSANTANTGGFGGDGIFGSGGGGGGGGGSATANNFGRGGNTLTVITCW